MEDGSKIPAERMGIRPAYGETDEGMLRRVGELGRPPPYMFRGEPCSIGQLKLLLAVHCDVHGDAEVQITPNSLFLRAGRRHFMFQAATGADGVVTIHPDFTER